jgi:hypothetical protein
MSMSSAFETTAMAIAKAAGPEAVAQLAHAMHADMAANHQEQLNAARSIAEGHSRMLDTMIGMIEELQGVVRSLEARTTDLEQRVAEQRPMRIDGCKKKLG